MKIFKHLFGLILIASLVACNSSDNATNTDTASISIKLVDDPGDYENVFVDIIDVMVKYDTDDADDNSGWQSLDIINPGVYDLLELTGGLSLELVDNADIETGTLKQIRLVLGDANSVLLSGETESRPLTTPSAQQSGLKIMVNQTIEAGFNYDFILDFDVDESIVVAGNSGNIILKPVLRASLEINSGSLSGSVLPTGIAVEIVASNGTINATTNTNDLGNFQILGLPEGFYTVTITPEVESNLNPVVIEDVEITVGQTTVLDQIILE